ncbi:26S proteasome non-ATPase regulatory subunit 3-like [Centruroides sculpturatus]|uniref:26S proteasome non-ATPase regulatory subunit 3-like n=1 Tax=Centruroides sculpturatus TaxID=218467 RepID=UPI000C6EF973|nr:26S proteasome non-ATPase regulatory subunit 3-like [Centruroides sculpturatus]
MVTEHSNDVEMRNADDDITNENKDTETKDVDTLTLEDIKEHARHIEKAVLSKEPRFILRVLRVLVSTRKRLNPRVLKTLVNGFYTQSSAQREALLSFISTEEQMDVDNQVVSNFRIRSGRAAQTPLLTELDVYIHLLVLLHLIDSECQEAQKNPDRMKRAVNCSEQLMQKIQGQNRRTLDTLAARCYFYHTRCYELAGRLHEIRTITSRFITSPSGRINAIQLEYTKAHKNLLQAIRKAPQHTAIGFKQTAYKLAITVELLLGEIPDRSLFRQPTLRKSLAPYFQLTQAVRQGNLFNFNGVVDRFSKTFQDDHTFTLIIRLRHNVIKTGVRMINLSYSRISLANIASKLQLDSSEDSEFIVAKDIRDGVIEANVDHHKGYMQSKENIDVYCTREPQTAFHQRITFCLNIHNQSVKVSRLRFVFQERREREQQDLEYAKEMADEDDEFP